MNGAKVASDRRLNSDSAVTRNTDRAANCLWPTNGVTTPRQLDMFVQRPHDHHMSINKQCTTHREHTIHCATTRALLRREVHHGQVVTNHSHPVRCRLPLYALSNNQEKVGGHQLLHLKNVYFKTKRRGTFLKITVAWVVRCRQIYIELSLVVCTQRQS